MFVSKAGRAMGEFGRDLRADGWPCERSEEIALVDVYCAGGTGDLAARDASVEGFSKVYESLHASADASPILSHRGINGLDVFSV